MYEVSHLCLSPEQINNQLDSESSIYLTRTCPKVYSSADSLNWQGSVDDEWGTVPQGLPFEVWEWNYSTLQLTQIT